MKRHFYTLWAINAALDEPELCRQLDQMRAGGYDGTVFHPRFYPNEPAYLSDEYLAIISRVILHAKSIAMDFWIYDENGWPSGTVGGAMLRDHPDCRQQWREADGQIRSGPGVDYLNPALAQNFLKMTYERYRDGLEPAAWEHVTTFFCDEPEFGLGHAYDQLPPSGASPWTTGMTQSWFETSDRVQFWESLTDRFCAAFIAPLNEWCRQHGKRFTAHVKGEEHPLFQVPMVGSCQPVFRHLGLPGIDALEREPSGHFFPRQVASVAQQFGTGECMVECFGGAGWGATPEDFERYLTWLAGHGLTHFVVHLWQYRLTPQAIQDWPPSHGHLNWREVTPLIFERIRQLPAPRPADTLVVAPYRKIMAEFEPRELLTMNIHNAATYADTPAGRVNREFLELLDRVHQSGAAYHVSDERTVEEFGQWQNGVLHVGQCAYRTVVDHCAPTLVPTVSSSRLSIPVGWENLPANVGVPGPNGTVRLPADDYPFRSAPVVVRGTFESPGCRHLQLTAVRADCARVFVNGKDYGWCWGPDWGVAVNVATGRQEIEVWLTPSTYNLYGPHQHVTGDPHVVSPAQYAYTKNFADPPDAPANTRTDDWHFKPVGIGATLLVDMKENHFAATTTT